MNGEVIIRRYRPSDADAVADLRSRAVRQAHPSTECDEADEGAGAAESWVAERSGTVVALLGLLGTGPGRAADTDPAADPDAGPAAEIGALFIAPDAQRDDIGRELVEHAAARHGALALEVGEGDAGARRFWAGLGFAERARRVDGETGRPLLALERGAPLRSVAWLHVRDGRLLSVRTRGNDTFYLPGGKYEPGETAAGALSRELSEELGLTVPAGQLAEAFVIHDVAHGKGGRRLHMTCFTGGPQEITPVPGREIAEYAWFGRREARERCAPAHSQVVDRLIAQGRMAPEAP